MGGPVNAETGMVCDLGELDAFAQTNLLERFDRMNLNTLDEFREAVPTTENFTREVYRIFQGFSGARRLCGYGSRRRETIRLSTAKSWREAESI